MLSLFLEQGSMATCNLCTLKRQEVEEERAVAVRRQSKSAVKKKASSSIQLGIFILKVTFIIFAKTCATQELAGSIFSILLHSLPSKYLHVQICSCMYVEISIITLGLVSIQIFKTTSGVFTFHCKGGQGMLWLLHLVFPSLLPWQSCTALLSPERQKKGRAKMKRQRGGLKNEEEMKVKKWNMMAPDDEEERDNII